MRLKDWAEAVPGRYTDLHFETKLAWSTIYGIALGAVSPRLENARKLSEATDGAVTVEEIMDAFDPRLAAARRSKEADRRAKRKKPARASARSADRRGRRRAAGSNGEARR